MEEPISIKNKADDRLIPDFLYNLIITDGINVTDWFNQEKRLKS